MAKGWVRWPRREQPGQEERTGATTPVSRAFLAQGRGGQEERTGATTTPVSRAFFLARWARWGSPGPGWGSRPGTRRSWSACAAGPT